MNFIGKVSSLSDRDKITIKASILQIFISTKSFKYKDLCKGNISHDEFTFTQFIQYSFRKMGAMCGQSSQRSCLIPVKDTSKIAVYGPTKTGKTSLISYLTNRQNSISEKTLITGVKKTEYLSSIFGITKYNGTKFQGLSARNKMMPSSINDNALPFELLNMGTCSFSPSRNCRVSLAQIKNSEGNIFPILESLFLSQGSLLVIDPQTIDQLSKYQKLTIYQSKRYRLLCLNKIDQLSQQSAQRLYKYLNDTYQQCIVIPISSIDGDNIYHRSTRTNWYTGPTLHQLLEKQEPSFYNGIALGNYSNKIAVLKVSHKNKKTTTIFGMYTGSLGVHIQYVLQILPLGIAATVIGVEFQDGFYVSLTLDQYLTIDQEKCLFLLSHIRKIPQNPTNIDHLSILQGTITYFNQQSIKQAGFKCLIHYHNKVVKAQLISYKIPYNNNQLQRHGKFHLFQLLWHEQNYGRFYILDQKNNPIAVGVQQPYRIQYKPKNDVQPIIKEPIKVEEEIEYKITLEIKSKKTLK